jgi:hypothetical protein
MALSQLPVDPGAPAELDALIVKESERALVHVHILRWIEVCAACELNTLATLP